MFYPDTDYVRLDGEPQLTTNSNGIVTEYPIDNQVSDEAGINFWTGIDMEWTTSDLTCDGWTNDGLTRGDEPRGRVGWTETTGSGWIEGGSFVCSRTAPLLCVEQ